MTSRPFGKGMTEMARRHYQLPSLTTLACFEAAARHLSFKNAAQELSVTPGAVSHQIKALESELGVVLFRRKHRGVELTAEGQELFKMLAESFFKISQCLKNIQEKYEGNRVTVGSTSAVASLWLSPSVIRFWRAHPEVDVNQSIQEADFQIAPEIDLYIRYGKDPDPTAFQTPLFRDLLLPVADYKLAERLRGAPLDLLAQERLIHLDAGNNSWPTWADWFRKLGYDGRIAPGIRVNNYSVAMQVAQDGAGIALGWKRLSRPLITSGQLHPIAPYVMPAPQRFHLVSKPDDELSEAALKLKNWIIEEIRLSSDEINSSEAELFPR